MFPGRFWMALGSGEAANEHITGERWPETEIRLEMLEEAITVMRLLWQGGNQSHHGTYYTVENARLYTLPEDAPPLLIAASGPNEALGGADIEEEPREEPPAISDDVMAQITATYS